MLQSQPCHWRNAKSLTKRSVDTTLVPLHHALSENVSLFQSLRVLQDGETADTGLSPSNSEYANGLFGLNTLSFANYLSGFIESGFIMNFITLYVTIYAISMLYLPLSIYLFITYSLMYYTGCPRRNVPNFGRVFLMLNYTDITQNTYIQS